jgi:integrase
MVFSVDLPNCMGKFHEMKLRATKTRFAVKEFTNPSGEIAFRVQGYHQDGRRVRENYRAKGEAFARQQQLEIDYLNDATALTARATTLPESVLRDAERAIVDLPPSKTLVDAVKFYRENWRETVTPTLIADALEEFATGKKKANRRAETVRNLRQRINQIVLLRPEGLVSEICADDLKAILHGTSPKNADNYRRAWSGFFRWAILNEYMERNPLDLIERPEVESGEIHFMTNAEVVALLDAATTLHGGELVPYVALFTFGGLRHTEIDRLHWSKIDFEDGTIRIDDAVAKTRRRRLIQMPRVGRSANLLAWLEPYRMERKPFVGKGWRKKFDSVKIAAGWGTGKGLRPWVQDILRHTAISNHFAHGQHEGQTASWAGNSPTMVHKFYKGLIKAKEAKVFWALRPGKRNVIKMKEAA